MHKVVFIRHGESEWNKKNLFTGWTDVPMTEKGEEEVRQAARILKEEGYTFDRGYASVLKRSIKTLWIVLEELDLMWIPTVTAWKLNERHYGALMGMNKQEASEKEGEEQVFLWRRSYKACPPELEESDERNPRLDPKYKNVDPKLLPLAECLEDAQKRVMSFWEEELAPKIKAGEKLIIASHGTTMRSLISHFENLSEKEVSECNVPYGIPLVFEFDKDMKFLEKYYLGDQDYVAKCIAEVAGQHKISK